MTEQERKIKKLEEEKKKKKKTSIKPTDKLVSEDGTLSSFGFTDNYK
jgi:hypothetical protein